MRRLDERYSVISHYDMSDYLEKRLQIWVEWFSRIEDNGLGFPRRSVEARLMESGGLVSAKSKGPKLCYNNFEAEEIEDLVLEMHQQVPSIAVALRAYYFDRGTTKIKAAKLGISRAQFSINVEMAKKWLAGHLTACTDWKKHYRSLFHSNVQRV